MINVHNYMTYSIQVHPSGGPTQLEGTFKLHAASTLRKMWAGVDGEHAEYMCGQSVFRVLYQDVIDQVFAVREHLLFSDDKSKACIEAYDMLDNLVKEIAQTVVKSESTEQGERETNG